MPDAPPPTTTPRPRPPATDGEPAAVPVRTSFRRRLLVTLGSALAVVFLVLGILTWVAAYAWLTYDARVHLKREAEEIAFHIVSPGGRLRVNRYAWHEPHHRYAERRIDPYFVQVFDARGALLHTSDNVQTFPPGSYPQRLLKTDTDRPALLAALNTFRAGEDVLYYDVFPLAERNGAALGYVQVARYEPGIATRLRRLSLFILAGLGGLLAGLLLLTHRVARRVLRPLESITRATDSISPRHLHRRVTLDDEADRETAQLAATLNTLLDRLETSFEEMQRFTADAAHELQTPLTVLRGHVDVALRRPRTADSYQETLRLLGSEIDHLTRMVRGLLGLARLDQAPFDLYESDVDLSAIVEEAAAAFRERARARGLAFEIHTPGEAWIYGKPDLLRDVVGNVLDNAVKYTPQGSVTVRLTRGDGRVDLTVTDTGIGIPAEALPHVTDRFYRAASVQQCNIPGHGLGLSLVARILALHGGRLDIASQPGRGTTVRMTFPEK